ncbi:unnamed protein product [Linum trigynum]|uniref:Uncharacterized protein n=1 Tax=Linum trigynum TaxID=586398 RepID=A0AAV2DM82_9ROSI
MQEISEVSRPVNIQLQELEIFNSLDSDIWSSPGRQMLSWMLSRLKSLFLVKLELIQKPRFPSLFASQRLSNHVTKLRITYSVWSWGSLRWILCISLGPFGRAKCLCAFPKIQRSFVTLVCAFLLSQDWLQSCIAELDRSITVGIKVSEEAA